MGTDGMFPSGICDHNDEIPHLEYIWGQHSEGRSGTH